MLRILFYCTKILHSSQQFKESKIIPKLQATCKLLLTADPIRMTSYSKDCIIQAVIGRTNTHTDAPHNRPLDWSLPRAARMLANLAIKYAQGSLLAACWGYQVYHKLLLQVAIQLAPQATQTMHHAAGKFRLFP